MGYPTEAIHAQTFLSRMEPETSYWYRNRKRNFPNFQTKNASILAISTYFYLSHNDYEFIMPP